jgi:uncharacterized protein (DUF2235 family)
MIWGKTGLVSKNILIFSDGTGQAGGISVDENRSNIYKLYRATRVSPDSCINPSEQVAFYDAGLGSAPINGGFFTTMWRYVHNFVGQATGYGITTNIIDCYDMIIRLWRPGDRIYLFGFSRGAYTVRCVAGVLRLCGVPTRIGTEPLTYAPSTTRAIAKEAVKKVYQHTASWVRDKTTPRQLELLDQRDELAVQFRNRYKSSDANGNSNGYPYFIGVFDTVAALGNWEAFFIFAGILVVLIATLSTAFWYLYPSPYWLRLLVVIGCVGLATAIGVVVTSFKSAPTVHGKGRTAHFEWGRFKFYDHALSDNIKYGKHAISIDENRADFERVGWGDPKSTRPEKDELGNRTFEQVWFPGNHSDIGGSYPENESRLSDIALGWMIEVATAVPHPIQIDWSVLRLHPDPGGMQHDECRAGIKYVTRLCGKTWRLQHRRLPGPDTTIHDTVRQRFDAGPVLQYDQLAPYRTETLRVVDAYQTYFKNLPYSACNCATCRKIRGLPPLPTIKSRFAVTVERAKSLLKTFHDHLGPRG